MREATWLKATAVTPLLEYLHRTGRERKLRLFACACCRLFWHLLTRESSRRADEAAEQYADGLLERAALTAAGKAAVPDVRGYRPDEHARYTAASAARWCALTRAWGAARGVSGSASALGLRHKRQLPLLRDICGNPFRVPALLDPACLAANDGAVLQLATAIYQERAFDRLPILADALEEAGCVDAEILTHCRQPGGHARGCWVVDWVLGRS
jgi:hypothetical protein